MKNYWGDDTLRIVDKKPSVNGDIIIYETRWANVQDLADTLLPLMQSKHGADARILPHRESNKLIVLIPRKRNSDSNQRVSSPPPRVQR